LENSIQIPVLYRLSLILCRLSIVLWYYLVASYPAFPIESTFPPKVPIWGKARDCESPRRPGNVLLPEATLWPGQVFENSELTYEEAMLAFIAASQERDNEPESEAEPADDESLKVTKQALWREEA
jgi:hypothetical protein